MKNIITLKILYAICIIRFILTFLYFAHIIKSIYVICLMIPSIPCCLAFAWYEEWAVVCMVALMFILVLWISIIVVSLIGIKKHNIRRLSALLICVATVFDLVLSTFIATISVKISCIFISVLLLIYSICVYKGLTEKTNNTMDCHLC